VSYTAAEHALFSKQITFTLLSTEYTFFSRLLYDERLFVSVYRPEEPRTVVVVCVCVCVCVCVSGGWLGGSLEVGWVFMGMCVLVRREANSTYDILWSPIGIGTRVGTQHTLTHTHTHGHTH